MNSKLITDVIRYTLNRIDNTAELQSERGANDIRRRQIANEIKDIERLLIELKRRNQEG